MTKVFDNLIIGEYMVIPQPERILLRKQMAKFAPHIRGIILDVGAGKTRRYDDLFKFDKYLTLDINPDNKPDILASVEEMPLEDDSIDSIICNQVFGDVADIRRGVAEFYRVLRPGGVVIFTESQTAELHDEPYDLWRFTNFSLKKLFAEAGFKVLEVDQRGGFFCVMMQMKIRYLIDRFDLYTRWWARVLNPFFKICCHLAIFLDNLDQSVANKKHALGWCVLAKK